MSLATAAAPTAAPAADTRRKRRRRPAPWVVVELFAVVLTCAVFGTDGKSDLAVFLTAGEHVSHGINPYVPTDSPLLLDGHAFVYPWLSAWLFVPLSALPEQVGLYAFTLLGVAAVIGGSRMLGLPHGWAVAALLLCAPFARNAELGAVNACFFFCLAALWRWRERTWVVAGCITLLVGLKLFLAPVVLWVLLTRSWRCSAATLAALAVYFGGSFAGGPLDAPAYLAMLRRLSDYFGHRGMGLESAVAYFAPGTPARVIVLAIVGVALTATVTVFVRGGRRDEAGLLGALVILSLLATPMLWRHYLLLLFFVLVLLRPTTRTLWAASAGSWVVIGSARLEPVGGMPLGLRFICLYAATAALLYGCLRAKVAPKPADRVSWR